MATYSLGNSEGDSSSPEKEMNDAAIRLSRSLDDYFLERLKLVCTVVGLSERLKEELDDQFSILFKRLKQTLNSPNEAVLFCCQVLQQLGYNATDYFRETATEDIPNSYDYKTRHPPVDCMLTVLGFVDSLGKYDLSIVRTHVCECTKQSSDRVKTSVDLVNVLFVEGLVSVNDISFVLKLAKKFNRLGKFDEYLARQEKSRKKLLAEAVSRDGVEYKKPKIISKRAEDVAPVEEVTPKEEQQKIGNSDGKVADWLAKLPNEQSVDDKCSLYSDRTATTAPYAVDDKQDIHQGSGVNQLVLPGTEGNKPSEVKNRLLKCMQEESAECHWYRLGQELKVEGGFLNAQEMKNRSDSYKLEEVLCEWEESKCSEISLDNAIRVLESLQLEHIVSRLKDVCD